MRVDDAAMADELEHRFQVQLGKAIAEAYSKGSPELAASLDLTREWMIRSKDATLERLHSMNIYAFPPEVYHTLLDLAAKQTVQQALERVEREKIERESSLLSKRAQKWAVPLGVSSICVGIVTIAIETTIQMYMRLHH